MIAIETKDPKKSFGDFQAVQGISFEVAQGDIFSLLDPNGAGKTATISILSCLLRSDNGNARVIGSSTPTDVMRQICAGPD